MFLNLHVLPKMLERGKCVLSEAIYPKYHAQLKTTPENNPDKNHHKKSLQMENISLNREGLFEKSTARYNVLVIVILRNKRNLVCIV